MRLRSIGAPFFVIALAAACTSSNGASSGQTGSPDSGVVDASGSDASSAKYDFSAVHAALFSGTWKTEGVVILHAGQLVYEEYGGGFDASKRHIQYSASKSVGGMLAGIAIDQGLFKLSDSVCTYVQPPQGSDPSLCDTTIEHLLHMESGLSWVEDYGTASPASSDVLQMLYGDTPDMGLYAASRPRGAPAGTKWFYSSGDANLLARALKGALKGQDMRAWAKASLFDPAGLSSAVFESDRSGTLVFSSWLFLTPRDMAKLGQLYLDDGMVGAARVLPAGWVEYSTTPVTLATQPSPRDADAAPGYTGGSYGAQIWLNASSPSAPAADWLYPDVPVDAYSFEGHYGQKIFVVPSRNLVVARTGNDRDAEFDPNEMMKAAVSAIDKGGQ